MSLADVLKVDLSFEGGDLNIANNGDFRTVSLEANVKQAVFNRIMTAPGTLMHRPEYGVGLPLYLNENLTIQRKQQIARAIKQNLERDPRIQEVTAISINDLSEGLGKIDLQVSYVIAGYGSVTSSYEGIGA